MIKITNIKVLLPTLNEEKGISKTIDSINNEYFKKKKMELGNHSNRWKF